MVKRKFNPRTQGAITTDIAGRISGILDEVARQKGEVPPSIQRELAASRADVYGLGKFVSIEAEGQRTLRMQEVLDEEVTRENITHHLPHKDGRSPCQRVRRERG